MVDSILAKESLRVTRTRFRPNLPPGAIGKGAFGVVYRAEDWNQDVVAVKMIETKSEQNKELIAKEIEVLKMLGHPSIVNLRSVIIEPRTDWMFIVMEFVEGGDLLDRLTQDPAPFGEALVRVLTFHVTCGLAYAHSQGVIHRDIKPENILLCKDGFPKVADFGLARTGGNQMSIAPWRTVAGTPCYAAPEVQHATTIYDFSADVYSLGLVLADMILPQVCQDLLKLAQENPLPHEFWGVPTVMPQKAPAEKPVSEKMAAEIAGKQGYAVGSRVTVNAQGTWFPGIVEHISTTVCPGALHVRYKNGEGKDLRVLILPWHFQHCLRPDNEGGNTRRRNNRRPGDDAAKKCCCVVM